MKLIWNRYKKLLHCIQCISYDITYYWTSEFTVGQKMLDVFSECVFYILPGHKTHSSFPAYQSVSILMCQMVLLTQAYQRCSLVKQYVETATHIKWSKDLQLGSKEVMQPTHWLLWSSSGTLSAKSILATSGVSHTLHLKYSSRLSKNSFLYIED